METIPLYSSLDINNLRSHDIANFIRGSKITSNYDLASAFNSLIVRPSSRPLLGLKFLRSEGALRSNVACMGLRDSPVLFHRSLEAAQTSKVKSVLMAFFDDLLISGKRLEDAPKPPDGECVGIKTTTDTICPRCHVINCTGCKCAQCSAAGCKGHHPFTPIDFNAIKAAGMKFNALSYEDRTVFKDIKKFDPLNLLPQENMISAYYQYPLEKGQITEGLLDFPIPDPDLEEDDDISEEDLRDHLRNIFLALHTIQKHGSKASLKKSPICQKRLKFFGMEFSGQKAYIPESRKTFFQKMRDIDTVDRLYSFLGSLLFIAEFLPQQAHFTRPLYGYLNRPRNTKLPPLHR